MDDKVRCGLGIGGLLGIGAGLGIGIKAGVKKGIEKWKEHKAKKAEQSEVKTEEK